MPTVVIIHAAEDALPARALAEKLRQAKLTVELEKQSGDEVREALKGAQVSIGLWSPRSVDNHAVADDVAFAKGKSKLIHARMQNAVLPDQFRSDKAVDLTGWRGEDEFPAWRELAKQVTEKAGVAPLPPPAPRPPSGFFQPGAVPPAPGGSAQQPAQRPQQQPQQRPAAQQQARPPQAPPAPRPAAQAPRPAPAAPRSAPPQRSYEPEPEQKKGGGMVMIAIITFIAVAALGGGGYYFWSQQQSSQAASTAWDDVPRNDASAIRAFLAGDPGAHRADAQAALSQLEEQSFDAARDADTIDAFQGFLRDFPQSSHAIEARGRIAELQSLPDQTVPEGETTTTTTTDATNPDLVPPGATTPETGGNAPVPLTPPPTTTTPDATQPTP